MNPELLGMSNKELIQWACSHSSMTVDEMRLEILNAEVYCAQYPVSLYDYIEKLVRLSNAGVRAAKAGRALRKQLCVS